MLQPMLPMERMREPGWKWAKGFFSMGSSAADVHMPYVTARSSPWSFSRVRHQPLWFRGIWHSCGQR